jgi:hypothetical protein
MNRPNTAKASFAIAITSLAIAWLTSPCLAQGKSPTLRLHLSDPDNAPLSDAQFDVYRAAISSNKSPAIMHGKTDASGSANIGLDPGGYLIAVKQSSIVGDLGTRFDGKFYPLVSYVHMDKADREVTLQTLRMELHNCKIGSTDQFLQYLDPDEAGKKRRLEMVPGHAGRLIMMEGAPICSLSLQFPNEAEGPRGMHTYTPSGIEIYENGTVTFKTFSYDGSIKNAHDIMYLGANYVPDGKNRVLIDNLQKKSGVEVPLEPKAHILHDGRLSGFVSNISFISDEKHKPASLVFTYFYLDDPEHPINLNAMLSLEP